MWCTFKVKVGRNRVVLTSFTDRIMILNAKFYFNVFPWGRAVSQLQMSERLLVACKPTIAW